LLHKFQEFLAVVGAVTVPGVVVIAVHRQQLRADLLRLADELA
jgi:hypothetical protein